MKKLMFAMVAGVAATAAVAAPISRSSFESGETEAYYATGTNVVGEVGTSTETKFYYASASGSENTSAVKTYQDENVTKANPSYNNGEFSGVGDQFLQLSTENGTLYRTINARASDNVYGDKQTVTNAFYIDTLVQFTVCDSAPDNIDENAKLAIWLQASDDESTTNLMVKAKTYAVTGSEGEESFTGDAAIYDLGAYEAGTWYRLTVETIPNVFKNTKGAAGFKILVDGHYVHATNDVAALTGASVGQVAGMTDNFAGLTNAQNADTIFFPLTGSVVSSQNFQNMQVCAVGFSGTGFVDNIMFTEENPFFEAPTALDFTLTLGANMTGVSYSISSGGSGSISAPATSATIQAVPVGAIITLSSPVFVTTAWTKYKTAVTPGVNVASSTDTTITLKPGESFVVTDPDTKTAAATVDGVADAPAADATPAQVSAFLQSIGLSQAHADNFQSKAEYDQFMGWLDTYSENGYDATRLNAYAKTYERMKTGYPIEMMIAINPHVGVITSYEASTNGIADPESGYVTYKVDAGTTLTLSNFVFATPEVANKAYALNDDTTDATWDVSTSPEILKTGCSVAVSDGMVEYTTDVSAQTAMAGIGYKLVDVAPSTYDFTVTFGATISSVSYAISNGGASGSVVSGTPIAVPVGETITFTPVADSNLLVPAVKVVTDAGATTNAVATTYQASAAGAAEFFAEATAYGVTVTFGEGVTSANYVIGAGASTSATSGTKIAVPNGQTITFTPAASGLALPLFYTLADAGTTTNFFATATKTYSAAATDTFYAIAAAQAAGDDSEVVETATKTAIADAATTAEGAAVAEAVETKLAELDTAGIKASEVAAWKTTTASAVTYAAFANNANVAESIKLDTAVLFNKEPEAVVSVAEEGTTAGTYDLTFTITDGTNEAEPSATAVENYVKGLVKMTSDLSDWDGDAKITPTVTIQKTTSTQMKATIEKPENKPTVFMKIGK